MKETDLIIKRFRDAISASGYSFAELEKKTNIPKSNIQRWATGQFKRIPVDGIVSICNAIGVSPKYIMGWETPQAAIPVSGVIPIVGTIPAGYPAFADEDIIGYQFAPVPNADEYFYLRVSGDSMINKGITDGCLVLIHKQETADNGQIVAVRLNGSEATLKIFMRQGNTVVLTPANPAYNPIIVSAEQFTTGEAAIYGVVKFVMTEM